MTTSIASPEQTGVTPDTGRYTVLATCAYEFGPETGAHLLRRALTVQILADWYGMSPGEAIDHAIYGCDTRARQAGREADRLIEQARREAQAAEQDGAA